MKKLLLSLLLASSSVFATTVYEESPKQGVLILLNAENYSIHCVYQDRLSYFTFSIEPHGRSKPIPINGAYSWICK